MKQDKIKPMLFSVMKNYDGKKFVKDVVAGIIVAIIALPLSIALALASGVGPEQGIYTAIVAGFLISFFGGSRVQIAGPTAAFATIVAGIIAKKGMDGLIIATVIAGIYPLYDYNRLYRRHRGNDFNRTDKRFYGPFFSGRNRYD